MKSTAPTTATRLGSSSGNTDPHTLRITVRSHPQQETTAMGDMAEAYLNGDFDMETGEWIGPGAGFPRTMTQNTMKVTRAVARKIDGRFPCPRCGKKPPTAHGLRAHAADVHGILIDVPPK